MRVAVDFDGDGRRDLVDKRTRCAGLDRQLPGPIGLAQRRAVGLRGEIAARLRRKASPGARSAGRWQWVAMGLSRIGDEPVAPHDGPAALLLPAGAAGRPSWCSAISTRSTAITRPRAMRWRSPTCPTGSGGGDFVATLADRRSGISRAERRELQTLLLERGHDIGEVDGMIGSRTRKPSRPNRRGWASRKTVARDARSSMRCAARVPSGRRAALTPMRGRLSQGTFPCRAIPRRRASTGKTARSAFLEREADPATSCGAGCEDMLSSQPGGASKIWPSSNAPAATSITPIRAPARPAAATSASLLPRCRSPRQARDPAPVRRRACGCRARPRGSR